jgi:hypothetical protein
MEHVGENKGTLIALSVLCAGLTGRTVVNPDAGGAGDSAFPKNLLRQQEQLIEGEAGSATNFPEPYRSCRSNPFESQGIVITRPLVIGNTLE